jgi:hypothetical protein
MSGSRIYSPTGNVTTDCGPHYDQGAQYQAYTASMADDIIAWARSALRNE